MKANELRIGNLVLVDNELHSGIKNKPMIVCSIQECKGLEKDTWSYSLGLKPNIPNPFIYNQLIQFIEPIPLTEEWLLKFGFTETGEKWFSKGVIVLGYITTEDNLQTEYCTPTGNWTTIDIKHVHQLQNLYFALTGQELTP